MDGTKLVSVVVPALTGVAAPAAAEEKGAKPTLVSGSLPPHGEPRPTTPVQENATASLSAGAVTMALAMGDTGLVGAVLADRYKLEGLIGRGGMGVVYRARHLLLDRSVAVKLLRPQYLSDERASKRFLREAQAMARVEHPNAVTIYDFGMMPDGGAYLVMEFIEGETLRALLGRAGTLPVAEAVAVAEQICGAVEAAHRQGVVHRDLKPENIMFKRAEEGVVVKVVDFGLAKVVDGASVAGAPVLTSAGDLFGTPAYMAPEFFENEEVGPSADVYSIGIVAYEMLAGSPPFQGSVQTIMSGHLFKEPPALAESGSAITPALEDAIRRALCKSPAARYASAAAFAASLVAAASGNAHSEPLTGAITTPIRLDNLPRPSGDLDPDEAPTFMGSPDEVETFGGPKRISTADIVAPERVSEPEPELEPDTENEPVTASVPVPPMAFAPRRRALPAAAAVLGLIATGVLVFAVSSHTDAPKSVDATLPPATPAIVAAPELEQASAEASAPSASELEPEPTAPADPAAGATRPSISRMEVAPVPKPGRTAGEVFDERPAEVAPKPEVKPPVRDDARDPAKSDTKDDKKADQAGAKNAKDTKKKKRRWYNPFSW